MRFTQAAAYGISALSYLANCSAGERVSNTTICAAQQMPPKFVLQQMLLLVNAGIVTSTQGRHGGFQLAKPANKISLLEIVEAVDGTIGGNKAIDLTGLAENSKVTIENAMSAITSDARKQLAGVTLADLRAAKAA